MNSHLQAAPDWWKSGLDDIERLVHTVKKGNVRQIGKSAGNRNMYLFEYGKRDVYERTANYSSALGCGYISTYKQNKHPHILIINGVLVSKGSDICDGKRTDPVHPAVGKGRKTSCLRRGPWAQLENTAGFGPGAAIIF